MMTSTLNISNPFRLKIERTLLEHDIMGMDDENLHGSREDNIDSNTRLSSPDSSRQSVSQDSGVVSDIEVKEDDLTTPLLSIKPSIDITNSSSWSSQKYSHHHNSTNYGRHSSISGGDTFSSRSVSGSSEDSDSTDAGSFPSLTSYPESLTSVRSTLCNVQNDRER